MLKKIILRDISFCERIISFSFTKQKKRRKKWSVDAGTLNFQFRRSSSDPVSFRNSSSRVTNDRPRMVSLHDRGRSPIPIPLVAHDQPARPCAVLTHASTFALGSRILACFGPPMTRAVCLCPTLPLPLLAYGLFVYDTHLTCGPVSVRLISYYD